MSEDIKAEIDREESIIFATKFLEDILSFFGANLAVRATTDEDVIELSVPSTELNACLIGRNAETLRSLQYLVSMALCSKDAELTRVNVDVAEYKKQREDRIAEKAEVWIKKVRDTGQSYEVGLNAADRRIVHKVAQDYGDIETHSEGEGRERRIVISRVSVSE